MMEGYDHLFTHQELTALNPSTNRNLVLNMFATMRSDLQTLENKFKLDQAVAKGTEKLVDATFKFITSPEMSSVPTADKVLFDFDVVQFRHHDENNYEAANRAFVFIWHRDGADDISLSFSMSPLSTFTVNAHPGSNKASIATQIVELLNRRGDTKRGNEHVFNKAVTQLRKETTERDLVDAQRKLERADKLKPAVLNFLAAEGSQLPCASDVKYLDYFGQIVFVWRKPGHCDVVLPLELDQPPLSGCTAAWIAEILHSINNPGPEGALGFGYPFE